MRLLKASVLTGAVLVLGQYASDLANAQTVGAVRVRVDVLKKSVERQAGDGPTLLGPQSAFEFEWRVLNDTGGTLELPTPETVLYLLVAGQGREIPVHTEWAANMTLRTRVNGALDATTLPFGAATLPDGSSLWVRGSTKLDDGSAVSPGDYVLKLAVRDLPAVSAAGGRTVPTVDPGFPIKLHILILDSLDRQRRFHMIEGGFYRKIDSNRALEHYKALASLPGAQWSDSLPLAHFYDLHGRHREATVVFRRILPDLIHALDSPAGSEILRQAGHLRVAARSFAIEGDVAEAAKLLRIDGRTPEARIPEEIERWRKSAPKALKQ